MSTFVLLTPDELAWRDHQEHHPLTPAIDWLAGVIAWRERSGDALDELESSRRVLLGLLRERASRRNFGYPLGVVASGRADGRLVRSS